MSAATSNPQELHSANLSWTGPALEYCLAQTRRNLLELESFPELTRDGRWVCVPGGGWVGGHWVGILWLCFAHTRASEFEQAARSWAARLVPRRHDAATHDLGFLFELSHLLGAQLTGDASLRLPALQAAHTLARRFNRRGGYLQAWGPLDASSELRGRSIIDTLMNLPLLFWASQETGLPDYAGIAATHARTCLACNVRSDFSTAHVADFDPDSGVFLRQDTHQGLSPTSCWSRGQSWGVFGFAEVYRRTADPAFLEASRGLADFALAHLPPDCVPYWDYASPLIPDDVRDSSAAAILAGALLRLAELDAQHAGRWQQNAIRILESLSRHYISLGKDEPGILLHGTRSKPHGLMDHSLIYGDYYYFEALTRLSRPGLLG